MAELTVRRRIVAAVAVGAVVLGVVAAVVLTSGGDSAEVTADTVVRPPRTTTTSSTTTSTTRVTTTTVPTTTAAPTTIPPTTAAPTTAAPTTTEPAPPPPPAPVVTVPPPMSVLVSGDSLGFTAAFPAPTPDQLPPSIGAVGVQARIGCGVLSSAGYHAIDIDDEGALPGCGDQEALEAQALGWRPTWMVFFSGGWEHLGWTAPDGRTLAARSPELRSAILDRLVHRARVAAAGGTRTAFVAWACPDGVLPHRQGDYAHWYNDVLREATRHVPGSIVIEATDRVCVGGDAGGVPTAEKAAAFKNQHPDDKAWTWRVWLGPALEAAR